MPRPEFTLIHYGRFRTHLDPRYATVPKEQLAEGETLYYEFEFYYEDWEGGLTIDGVLYPAAKGFFSCCKPGMRRYKVMPYRCYYLIIQPQDPQLKAALDALPVYASTPQMDAILELTKKVSLLPTTNTVATQLKRSSYFCTILSLLLEDQEVFVKAPLRVARRHQAMLEKANQYLREHADEKIDLQAMAKESGLTPTYFHKIFTATFGRTPAQQLLWYRMSLAFQYLRDDNCPLSEVAAKCGFSSQSYFSYLFKKRYEETPSQYRNRLRKEEGSP